MLRTFTILCATAVGWVIAAPSVVMNVQSKATLAYVSGGDVWVTELYNGSPTKLTADGMNTAPRWSPSGEYLAFIKLEAKDAASNNGGTLWLVRSATGDIRKVSDRRVTAFEWAPDSDRFVYVVDAVEVCIADAFGGNVRTVFEAQREGKIRQTVWNPDGRSIALLYARSTGALKPGWPWEESITVIALSGGDVVDWIRFKSTFDAAQEQYRPGSTNIARWYRGGILFWQGEIQSASLAADMAHLYLLSRPGAARHLLDGMLMYRDFIAPSPSGEEIAIADGAGREVWTGKRIVLIAGGRKQVVTPSAVSAISPSWAPDGAYLAYCAAPAGDPGGSADYKRREAAALAQRRIWIVKANGSEPRRLTAEPSMREEFPLWSSDGSRVLFLRMNSGGGVSICVAGLNRTASEIVPALLLGSDADGYYGYVDWGRYLDWRRN
jgi:dipeptidyl aminopeptidase/acylaminoacyl peptidase